MRIIRLAISSQALFLGYQCYTILLLLRLERSWKDSTWTKEYCKIASAKCLTIHNYLPSHIGRLSSSLRRGPHYVWTSSRWEWSFWLQLTGFILRLNPMCGTSFLCPIQRLLMFEYGLVVKCRTFSIGVTHSWNHIITGCVTGCSYKISRVIVALMLKTWNT